MGWYFPTLGLALALGLWLGENLAYRRGVPTGLTLKVAGLLILAGLVGARLFHVFFEGLWGFYRQVPLDILMPWKGGLSIVGGLLGSLLLVALLYRAHRAYLPTLAAAFTPPLFISLALARVGCFLNGCCHGHPADIPWATTYSRGSEAYRIQRALELIADRAPHSLPVHPTQLYEALAALLIGLVSLACYRSWSKDPARHVASSLSPESQTPASSTRRDWGLVGAALSAYCLFRFVNEFWRGDERGTLFWNLISVHQVVCLSSLVLIGLALFGGHVRASHRR